MKRLIAFILPLTLIVAQTPRPIGRPITVTNPGFSPTGPNWWGYLSDKSPLLQFGLDPAGSVYVDSAGPYPILKAATGSSVLPPGVVTVGDAACSPPCAMTSVTLGSGFWFIWTPDGHMTVNVDQSQIFLHQIAPRNPGPCPAIGLEGLDGGYLYICDTDLQRGRVKLEKAW